MPSRSDVLLRLVDLAYAAAQENVWEPFLLELADSVDASCAALLSHSLSTTGTVAAFARTDPDSIAAYNKRFHRTDPFARSLRAIPTTSRSGVYTGEMLISNSDYTRTEFFNEFAVPFEMPRMMTAIIQTAADRVEGRVTGLTLTRRTAFEDPDIELLQTLFPHLNRALEVSRRLQGAVQGEGILDSVFELLRTPAILVDHRARVLRTNKRAVKVLASSDALFVRGGCLRANMPDDTSRLETACATAGRRAQKAGPPGETMRIGSSSSQGAVQLIIFPITSMEKSSTRPDGACAIVLIDEPTVGPEPSTGLLRELYGLTVAEAEIAARIAMGDELAEIADARSSSLQTIQWFNKQILAKLACRSRSELVRRLTLSIASLAQRE